MSPSDALNPDEIKALSEALLREPMLAAKLMKLDSAKDRLAELDMKLAALTEETSAKMVQIQATYREKAAPDYTDVDVKKALVGFPVRHRIQLVDTLAVEVQAPTAKLQRAVEALDLALNAKPHELLLLAWVVGLDTTPMGGKAIPLETTPLPQKLDYLRSLPDMVLQRLAQSCNDFSSYLHVCLELDLGK